MSRRIYVTVPDFVGTVLDKVSQSEGNKPTTLAAFWLETRARELLDSGKVSLNNDDAAHNATETNSLMQNYLKQLASGSPVTDDIIQLLAKETELTEEELRGLRDRLSSQ